MTKSRDYAHANHFRVLLLIGREDRGWSQRSLETIMTSFPHPKKGVPDVRVTYKVKSVFPLDS